MGTQTEHNDSTDFIPRSMPASDDLGRPIWVSNGSPCCPERDNYTWIAELRFLFAREELRVFQKTETEMRKRQQSIGSPSKRARDSHRDMFFVPIEWFANANANTSRSTCCSLSAAMRHQLLRRPARSTQGRAHRHDSLGDTRKDQTSFVCSQHVHISVQCSSLQYARKKPAVD